MCVSGIVNCATITFPSNQVSNVLNGFSLFEWAIIFNVIHFTLCTIILSVFALGTKFNVIPKKVYVVKSCLVLRVLSYCEVYRPDMPTRLPISDFVSGLVKNILRALKYWLHYTLVALAWLGVVPITACECRFLSKFLFHKGIKWSKLEVRMQGTGWVSWSKWSST